MNNKGADQTAPLLFAYGINRFSRDLAHMEVPESIESKDADRKANNVESEEQCNLGLHCLPRPFCH